MDDTIAQMSLAEYTLEMRELCPDEETAEVEVAREHLRRYRASL